MIINALLPIAILDLGRVRREGEKDYDQRHVVRLVGGDPDRQ